MLLKFVTFLTFGGEVIARRGGGSRYPTSSKNTYNYNRYNYRTTARPERDMCQEMSQQIEREVHPTEVFGFIETAGLVDFLFDDSYEDFSVVDLYKFARDDTKNEYQFYKTVKKDAVPEANSDSSFQQLMSDPTKRYLHNNYYFEMLFICFRNTGHNCIGPSIRK